MHSMLDDPIYGEEVVRQTNELREYIQENPGEVVDLATDVTSFIAMGPQGVMAKRLVVESIKGGVKKIATNYSRYRNGVEKISGKVGGKIIEHSAMGNKAGSKVGIVENNGSSNSKIEKPLNSLQKRLGGNYEYQTPKNIRLQKIAENLLTKNHNQEGRLPKVIELGGLSSGSGVTGPPSVVKKTTSGGVIRQDKILEGSKLEYLGPGRVKFDGVEFRAVRDLGHLSKDGLKEIVKKGVVPKDIFGKDLQGHHYKQKYHREPNAFMIEIPRKKHSISNKVQHPLGNSGGLSKAERKDWDKLRKNFHKERAKNELKIRELKNE
jgi:hypothetical protein